MSCVLGGLTLRQLVLLRELKRADHRETGPGLNDLIVGFLLPQALLLFRVVSLVVRIKLELLGRAEQAVRQNQPEDLKTFPAILIRGCIADCPSCRISPVPGARKGVE